jgi:outer membrane receptor protein involved in Fe transport
MAAGFVPARKSVLSVAIIAALSGAESVRAQDESEAAAGGNGNVEVVITTGTRIRDTGMDLPNPVTIITREEMSVVAPTNIIEAVSELPQFYVSSTTQTVPMSYFISTGAGSLNLRGLQSKRTLQLLDGRRVVPSTIFGGPDVNLFPENVLRSVETVTGGASAAYGTDAVAGVVNFILDTNFEGLRANLSTGANEKGHGEHYEASFAAGFALGESDNTHLLVSAEKSAQDPIQGNEILEYDWYKARTLIENPDVANRGTSQNNPFYIAVDQFRSNAYSLDGILYLPSGAQILNPDGTTSPYDAGNPCNAHGCATVAGDSFANDDSAIPSTWMSPDSSRENLFVYVEHEFNGNFRVYGQAIASEADFMTVNYGGLFGNPPGANADRAFTIFSGNPFLPANIQQEMTNNGTQSVLFGRLGAPEDIAFDAHLQQITETNSLTGGFEYDVGGDGFFGGWQLRGYYQLGETDVNAVQRGGIRLDRIYLAMDVVPDPLNGGAPACNVTVTTRGTADPIYQDCVPLNLFGRGRASAAAVDWVTGFEPGVPMHADGFLSATESMPHDYVSGPNKQRVIHIEQDVWEFSADGQISEGWAGPVTMGFGFGFREESFTQVVEVGPGGNVNADPRGRPVLATDLSRGIRGVPGGALASGNSVEIQFSNVPFARGEQDVTEAFTEFLVPLMTDRPGVEQLNLSAAARWADYSGAGDQQSWKMGFDWAIVEQLRLRTTVSEDVRAATMGEKFDRTGGITNPALVDVGIVPVPSAYQATQFSNGSPDIKPEQAKTKTWGFVFQPLSLSGLSISVDWYSVVIEDNIQQAAPQAVINGCHLQNDPTMCALITRGGSASIEDPSINYISLIGVPYFNQARTEAEGIDYELNYRTNVNWFGGGESVGLRFFASYLDERSEKNTAAVRTKLEGTFGQSPYPTPYAPSPETGLPELTALLSGTYNRGPLGLGLSARYTSSMIVQRQWNTGFAGGPFPSLWDVTDNEVEDEYVVDARFDYRFETANGDIGIYFSINNLFDEDPQPFLERVFSSNFSAGTNINNNPGVYGESRGRRYTIGARMDFGGFGGGN